MDTPAPPPPADAPAPSPATPVTPTTPATPATPGAAEATGVHAEMVVEDGRNRGFCVVFTQSLLVGRDADCDLRLFDDGVAQRQFRVHWTPQDGFLLQDLTWDATTRVAGKSAGNRSLYHLDEITFGPVRLRFLCPSYPDPEKTSIELASGSRSLPADARRLPTPSRRFEIDPKQGLQPSEQTGYPTPNLVTVFNVGQEIARQGDSRAMYEALLEAAGRLVPTGRVVLSRYHEDSQSLVPFLHRKAPGDRAGGNLTVDQPLVESCCRLGKALVDRGDEVVPHRLAIPLEGRERVHAALFIEIKGAIDPRPLLALFAALCRQAGLVLDQFELVAAVRQRNLLLETLHRETIEASQAFQFEQAKIRALMEAFHEGIVLLHETGEVLLSNTRGVNWMRKVPELRIEAGGILFGGRPLAAMMEEAHSSQRTLTVGVTIPDEQRRLEVTVGRSPLRWRTGPKGEREPEFGYALVFRDLTGPAAAAPASAPATPA